MTIAEVEARTNGTSAPAMPTKTAEIKLDEFGYPGWLLIVRTDPPSSVYDQLFKPEDDGGWWAAFGKVVLDWNLTDDDGHVLPLPREANAPADLDLRIGLLAYMFNRYLDAVRVAAEIPKASSASSSSTLSTSGADQKVE